MSTSTTSAPTTAATPMASEGRPWYRIAMHWVRRVHLYSGLFMFPWVMLYAITALLFNHPGAFPDRPQRVLTPADFAGTALETPADPGADAEQVVAALNAKFAKSSQAQPRYRIIHPEKAGYTRDVLSIRARGTGQEHSVSLDIAAPSATVSTAEQPESKRAPFATRGLKVPGSLGERVKAGIPKALAQQGLAADEAGMSIGTDLVFYVETDGEVWRAVYSVQSGAVTGSPFENPDTLSTRRFLTQLHMTHGYPSSAGMRWVWAIAIDAMFASMVFWGLSGLFMWWQIKAVRFAGLFFLGASLIVATIVAVGMYGHLAGP